MFFPGWMLTSTTRFVYRARHTTMFVGFDSHHENQIERQNDGGQ